MKLAGLIVVISSSYVNSNPRPIWHTGIKGALVSFAQKYAFCWLLTLKKVSFSCIDSHFIYELGKISWKMISWFVAKKISGPLAHPETHYNICTYGHKQVTIDWRMSPLLPWWWCKSYKVLLSLSPASVEMHCSKKWSESVGRRTMHSIIRDHTHLCFELYIVLQQVWNKCFSKWTSNTMWEVDKYMWRVWYDQNALEINCAAAM